MNVVNELKKKKRNYKKEITAQNPNRFFNTSFSIPLPEEKKIYKTCRIVLKKKQNERGISITTPTGFIRSNDMIKDKINIPPIYPIR